MRNTNSAHPQHPDPHQRTRMRPIGNAGRLQRVEQDLDQCWDLLRQRKAKENAAADPGEALARPTNEVEGYRQ